MFLYLRTNTLMRKFTFLLLALFLTFGVYQSSCKSLAKAAAKHWTKKQIRNFAKNCEEKVKGKLSEEKASSFCSCASEAISQDYSLEDANLMDGIKLLKVAANCALNI